MSGENSPSLLKVNFKDKDVFPILDINELVLHTKAHKGYVRTEPATTTKCWMLPGHVKMTTTEEKQKSISHKTCQGVAALIRKGSISNGATCEPASDGEGGILGDGLQRQQPTTPPTSVRAHCSSHGGRGGLFPDPSAWLDLLLRLTECSQSDTLSILF